MENNLIIYCYSSKSDINHLIDINPNLTYINLKECEKMLIKENQLNGNSDLIILGIQSESNSENYLVNNFNYDIYNRDGQKIKNFSICENITIELSSLINNLNLIDLDKALNLKEQGYDIFNISSNFYNDVCPQLI